MEAMKIEHSEDNIVDVTPSLEPSPKPAPERAKAPTKKEEMDIISLRQFDKLIPDEAAAIAFAEEEIWGHFPYCGRCDSNNIYRTETGKPMSHRCRRCRRHCSIRTGTTMAETNLPVRVWLLAIHIMLTSRKGVSALQLHKQLGVAYSMAWFLCHRIREAMRIHQEILSGIIQIDEAYFGGKAGRMHADKNHQQGRPGKIRNSLLSA